MSNGRVNWRQAGGEALLILLGVGVALLGQAWWEHRADRELERHLIEGVGRDLARDSADIAGATRAARNRAAGADQLLRLVRDPAVDLPLDRPGMRLPAAPGVPGSYDELLAEVRAEYAAQPLSAELALRMLGSLQRLDLSDATYREATASGQVDVIRDLDLRAAIGTYYFDAARFGITTDDRVDANAHELRIRLADIGLSPEGGASEEAVLSAIAANESVKAELSNVRGYAVRQIRLLAVIDASRRGLASSIDAWLDAHS